MNSYGDLSSNHARLLGCQAFVKWSLARGRSLALILRTWMCRPVSHKSSCFQAIAEYVSGDIWIIGLCACGYWRGLYKPRGHTSTGTGWAVVNSKFQKFQGFISPGAGVDQWTP